MKAQTIKLIQALTQSNPLYLSNAVIKQDFYKIAAPFKKLGLLKQTEPCKELECPNSTQGCFKEVLVLNGKLQICCDCDETAGTSFLEVSPKECEQHSLHIEHLLTWLAQELKLNGDIQQIDEKEIYFIGSKQCGEKTFNYYFIATLEQSNFKQLAGLIEKEDHIRIWAAPQPHLGALPDKTICLSEMLDFSSKTIKLNLKALNKLLPPKGFSKTGDIELDQHILLRQQVDGKCFLLLAKENGQYLPPKRISPQQYKIIHHLYEQRSYSEQKFSLEDYVTWGLAANKVTVSRVIKKINDICNDYEVKPIFHKFHDGRWGMNPELDCSKNP